ncbi:MAG: hypothetical protein A2Y40_05250 [Candidatus Margulisbacteria bacterium GWF2_35_9]|nr:MAG: hypothetical protein A2Y40_05250 [Candidatus Margulisbacteria bacterium GWF2_35_9]
MYNIGLVVPVYQVQNINKIIKLLIKTCKTDDVVICIVNDGQPAVKEFLQSKTWPINIEILNLDENRCFAGANNAGWKFLINKYPDLNYLGSINDDTIPKKKWLTFLVQALETNINTALSMPVMGTNRGLFGLRKRFSTWKLSGASKMLPDKTRIYKDTFVSAVNGYCFLMDRNVLEDINYFDEQFKNGSEDLDLGIRILLNGKRLIVCKKSYVFHFGEISRYKNKNTNISENHKRLAIKWDKNIERFNQLENGYYHG